MISILIPTYNNLEYLIFCIRSINKNSKFKHQIIVHVNVGDDGTLDYVKQNNIEYTYTSFNSGICSGINMSAKLAKYEFILYSHDDFYFSPNWDEILLNEVKNIGHKNFYLSGIMMNQGKIKFDCGQTPKEFDEKKFLKEYKKYNFYDFQGSTWAPTLVHKSIWQRVGGFSEEFFPGSGSDPDFNMKLWMIGIRLFKGLNDFKVYHFGSVVLRKKINEIAKGNKYGSMGGKIFLLKWGITIKFFKKYYLRSDTKFKSPLKEPNKNFLYVIKLLICKLNYFYLKIFYSKLKIKNSYNLKI